MKTRLWLLVTLLAVLTFSGLNSIAQELNQMDSYISVGSAQDEHEYKSGPGILAGMSVRNSHATTDAYIKCVDARAVNTTPGTSTIFYDMIVPSVANGSGFIDGRIEVPFYNALTCYLVTGKAATDTTSVGASDLRVNMRIR